MNATRKLGEYGLIALGLGFGIGILLFITGAHAGEINEADHFDQPYGMNPGDESRPIDAGTRDASGNRVIVNGQFVDSNFSSSNGIKSGVGSGLGGPNASATAIGNQLNVVTQGSWNTVIVNSDQENNGDVEAKTVLNGGLKL